MICELKKFQMIDSCLLMQTCCDFIASKSELFPAVFDALQNDSMMRSYEAGPDFTKII